MDGEWVIRINIIIVGEGPSTSTTAAEKKEEKVGRAGVGGDEKEEEDMVSFEDTQGTVAYGSRRSIRLSGKEMIFAYDRII